jgi:hypothetical protein
MKLITHLHPVPKLRMRGAIPPLLQYVFMAWYLVKNRDSKETWRLTVQQLTALCPRQMIKCCWNGRQTIVFYFEIFSQQGDVLAVVYGKMNDIWDRRRSVPDACVFSLLLCIICTSWTKWTCTGDVMSDRLCGYFSVTIPKLLNGFRWDFVLGGSGASLKIVGKFNFWVVSI